MASNLGLINKQQSQMWDSDKSLLSCYLLHTALCVLTVVSKLKDQIRFDFLSPDGA